MEIEKYQNEHILSMNDIHIAFDNVKFDDDILSVEIYRKGVMTACLYREKAKQLKEYWEQTK